MNDLCRSRREWIRQGAVSAASAAVDFFPRPAVAASASLRPSILVTGANSGIGKVRVLSFYKVKIRRQFLVPLHVHVLDNRHMLG
mmetsp:Transcript_7460/g.16162  ORF Transcript_7460/g.16162 Transcript_7460/m.16162 type:complete len:85 (+) Transcript_7460:84-338(+)